VHGPGIELPQGVPEPPAVNLPHDVSGCLFVEYRPETERLSVRLPCGPPEEKHGRMLGFDD